jgi:hypothetical protein
MEVFRGRDDRKCGLEHAGPPGPAWITRTAAAVMTVLGVASLVTAIAG